MLLRFRYGDGFPVCLFNASAARRRLGTVSVAISSWPTVSRPNSTGIKAPIATTARIVPKKIVAEPVCDNIKPGARTAAKSRPERVAENVPASAQCRRKLLGEVHANGGEGRQHGKTGDQPSRDHHHRRVLPRPVRHQHQEQAGKGTGERIGDRPPPPMISIRNPVKALPGMLAQYTSVATPEPKPTAAPWSTSALGSKLLIN